MKPFKVMARNSIATYRAGEFCAANASGAIKAAREAYANSAANRELRDVGSFHFYVVAEWPFQEALR